MATRRLAHEAPPRARRSARSADTGPARAGSGRRRAAVAGSAHGAQPGPAKESTAQIFMGELRADHARQSRLLRKIDAMAPGMRDRPEAVLPFLREAMQYLLCYQHRFHHRREDLLFEALRRKQPRLARDMRELLSQHRAGQRSIEGLLTNLQEFSAARGRRRTGDRLARALQDYAAHLRDHMRTEERVFYARAESALDAADWKALLARDVPADPLADPRRLEREYPQLALMLAQASTEVPRSGRPASARSGEGLTALRRLLERRQLELAEITGATLHDTVELLQSDLALAGRFLTKGPMQALQELAEQHHRTLTRAWSRNADFMAGSLRELAAVARGANCATAIGDAAGAGR